jgi:hypothetical protein
LRDWFWELENREAKKMRWLSKGWMGWFLKAGVGRVDLAAMVFRELWIAMVVVAIEQRGKF